MKKSLLRAGLLLCLFPFVASVVAQIEPWADETVPVQAGLQLWLDASRQNIARGAELTRKGPRVKRPGTPLGGPLDVWFDASGHQRDLRQPVPSQRPKLVQSPSGLAVRFDGVDDFVSTAT